VRTAEITLALEKKETQQETDYKSDIKKRQQILQYCALINI